jgi:hypothetical protein
MADQVDRPAHAVRRKAARHSLRHLIKLESRATGRRLAKAGQI